uniref:Uncharacterized protein n=1 Tax=Chromera velia CCMP2878 TaxID=1169474 RepID=A0A0G4FX71_9ALVE|eukprot:Cvel_19210.t1-p1 / transcript=Cvel_19210.t1 / gene=Cvel_19210 / organism=Chromera_velia_CCMP2878 / gene_product=hypothetical protein / transcript_product=hypothetical protein / location=Cvel_scaffold1640:24405-25953(+) / protein_length=337 / sequence_SO=supercontig / SO=protein_coding / is_pseudo=false
MKFCTALLLFPFLALCQDISPSNDISIATEALCQDISPSNDISIATEDDTPLVEDDVQMADAGVNPNSVPPPVNVIVEWSEQSSVAAARRRHMAAVDGVMLPDEYVQKLKDKTVEGRTRHRSWRDIWAERGVGRGGAGGGPPQGATIRDYITRFFRGRSEGLMEVDDVQGLMEAARTRNATLRSLRRLNGLNVDVVEASSVTEARELVDHLNEKPEVTFAEMALLWSLDRPADTPAREMPCGASASSSPAEQLMKGIRRLGSVPPSLSVEAEEEEGKERELQSRFVPNDPFLGYLWGIDQSSDTTDVNGLSVFCMHGGGAVVRLPLEGERGDGGSHE